MAMHLGGMGMGMPPGRVSSHQALVDSFNEQFRSPMSDDWAIQPRKARWNRKASRVAECSAAVDLWLGGLGLGLIGLCVGWRVWAAVRLWLRGSSRHPPTHPTPTTFPKNR